MLSFDRSQRWRLILGKNADEDDQIGLTAEAMQMDASLDALYNNKNKGGLGNSAPKVNRWLGDIRKYFPTQVVQVMQKDALENLGLKRMLLEPELLQNIEADVHLVGTLLSLNNVIPSKTRKTAAIVVQKVVDNLLKRLKHPLTTAIKGSTAKQTSIF